MKATVPDKTHIRLVKYAALRNGIELSENQAFNHASKILEWIESDDEYGQDFWTAAKEYFDN